MLVDHRFNRTIEDIHSVPLPAQTRTYFPVGHKELSDKIEEVFADVGRTVEDRGYFLKNGGDAMLGMLKMRAKNESEMDVPLTIMMRNSYDKSHAAGLASGPGVSYCLNMCIAGEDITYLRKHTRYVWRDLETMIHNAASTAETRYQSRLGEIDRLKSLPIQDLNGAEILGNLAFRDILKPRMFSEAMREWKNPRFQAFVPRNAWSLYNAVTWGIKKGSPVHISTKNPAAHEFFASLVSE